jgi:hypothetical protein
MVSSRPSSNSFASKSLRRKRTRLLLALLAVLCAISTRCPAQPSDITCDRGNGSYLATFFTGVTVSVQPVKNGAFATRACEARLTWNSQELQVASGAAQVTIDLLGSDLGLGTPVVAFQVRSGQRDAQSEYRIYSLKGTPALLRTVSGGSSYRASDTNLEDHIEIWTDDTKAVDGFEEIPAADLDFAPTVVLRFQKQHLLDVSADFQSHYDGQIAEVRGRLDAGDLADFRSTEGVLAISTIHSPDRLHRLLKVKAQVLEIVWSYLYSGREQDAWRALADLWPAKDLDRIRAALSNIRSCGVLAQAEGSTRKASWHFKSHAEVYDASSAAPSTINRLGSSISLGPAPAAKAPEAIIEPKSILLRRPPQPEGAGSALNSDETLEVVVDIAGKVHNAKLLMGDDQTLIAATKGWQFIPAFREGEPVACRFRLHVWDLK